MLIDCGRLVNIEFFRIRCRMITNVSNLSAKKEKAGADSRVFKENALKRRAKHA